MTGPDSNPAASVVVITYNDQRNLDRVLDALGREELATGFPASGGPRGNERPAQDGRPPTQRFEVIVADDGSREEPRLGQRAYPVKLVRQEDLGFRAAAARNLGARHARGDVLLFLDGDTIPEPGYVARLTAACREAGDRAPGPARGRGLAVGRRRHADLPGDGGAADLPPHPRLVLPEPQWLADGLAATDGLRAADDRSYRFVISAVLALTRELFEATAGFDESFVGYGGEDWDLANRCYLAGAEFVYEPGAVAWHDGPDAAGRSQDERGASALLSAKNTETRTLAEVITEPRARDPRLLWEIPDIAIDLDNRWPPETSLRVCAGLLHGSDARIWVRDPALLRDGIWPAADPRVQPGPIPQRVRARSRFIVTVTAPVIPARGATLADLCARGSAIYPGLAIRHARDGARGNAIPTGRPQHLEAVSDDRRLEAIWGGWAD